jgi:hypothetical protein
VSSPALAVFERLLEQVRNVEAAAYRAADSGHLESVPTLLRSAYVLTVAAFDTYAHERGIELLVREAAASGDSADRVGRFLSRRVDFVCGEHAAAHIRLALSYKTLVSPDSLDKLLLAIGLDAEEVWLSCAIALGSRPDRLRLQLQLIYDRRNQIAHEGDWDVVQIEFRPMEYAHLNDCIDHVEKVVRSLDTVLPLGDGATSG